MKRSFSSIRLKDLAFVILYTLLLSIVLAILLGLIDHLFIRYFSFQIGNLLFWILAIVTGSMVRKQYDQPHWLYAVIAGLGMLYGAVIIEVLPVILVFAQLQDLGHVIFDVSIYWEAILYLYNPINWIIHFDFNYLITILMIGVGTYLGVKRTLETR